MCSNFYCDKCKIAIIDSPAGYLTHCPHYPKKPQKKENKEIKELKELLRIFGMDKK